ncbi:3-keto-disaccharide hydrolase [Tundrisphaera sp. TA3]|uniref:3-keto-disaccharide hydrolase n=1 Tax=Tundrisphaera sp. TA3 TaxID=3435775 RepID=UPI003EBA7C99
MPARARGLALLLAPILLAIASAPAPPETPSALASDPSGWIDLLADAGPDLKGWTRCPWPGGQALAAESPWSFDPATGLLTCRGDAAGHEWLRLDREIGDAIFHVEWAYVPSPSVKPGRYNSGIYVRNSADANFWHQAQAGDGSGGYLFGDSPVGGKRTRVNLSKEMLDKRVRPAGEWNTFEVTCRGGDLTLWTNGAATSRWMGCEVPRGHVGLEAEGYRITFRNLKLKPIGPG